MLYSIKLTITLKSVCYTVCYTVTSFCGNRHITPVRGWSVILVLTFIFEVSRKKSIKLKVVKMGKQFNLNKLESMLKSRTKMFKKRLKEN